MDRFSPDSWPSAVRGLLPASDTGFALVDPPCGLPLRVGVGRPAHPLGAGSAGITLGENGRQAIGGIVTGVGIGAGIVFHREGGVRVSTTAATTFGVAAIGIVVGFGHLALGAADHSVDPGHPRLPHVPVLRRLDPENFRSALHPRSQPAATPGERARQPGRLSKVGPGLRVTDSPARRLRLARPAGAGRPATMLIR